MIRASFLLCLVIASSWTLDCHKCSIFSYDGMTETQSDLIQSALTALGSKSCANGNTVVTCANFEDECHNITVSSTIGGDTVHSGSLLQCGTSSVRNTLCSSYANLAGMFGVTLDTCETNACADDECFNPSQQNSAEDPQTPEETPEDETPLYCYKCYDLPLNEGMTVSQAELIEALLDIMGTTSCSNTSTDRISACQSPQDECNKITLYSTPAGSDAQLSGSLLQCGDSTFRNNTCATYTKVAGEYSITLSDCQTEACSENTCFMPGEMPSDNESSGNGTSNAVYNAAEDASDDGSDNPDNSTSTSYSSLLLILISLTAYPFTSIIRY